MNWAVRLALAGSLFLAAFEPRAHASDLAEPSAYAVFVPDLIHADDFARASIERIEEVRPNTVTGAPAPVVLDIVHFGEEIPVELRWLMDHYRRQNYKFRFTLKNPKEAISIMDEVEGAIDSTTLKETYTLRYRPRTNVDTEEHQVVNLPSETKSRFKKVLRSMVVHARHFFGLPNGMSWIMYKHSFTKRSKAEHIAELGLASLQSVMVGLMDYFAITLRMHKDPNLQLNALAAALAGASFKFVTGYIGRANNEFFVQGNNFHPEHLFRINRFFFSAAAYMHSLVLGVLLQVAARGLHGMDASVVIHTALNSVLGLFAKAVPLLLIAKHQSKFSVTEDSESVRHTV